MELNLSLSNLSEAFPGDMDGEQKARAQTLFLKKLSLKAQLVQRVVHAWGIQDFDEHTG